MTDTQALIAELNASTSRFGGESQDDATIRRNTAIKNAAAEIQRLADERDAAYKLGVEDAYKAVERIQLIEGVELSSGIYAALEAIRQLGEEKMTTLPEESAFAPQGVAGGQDAPNTQWKAYTWAEWQLAEEVVSAANIVTCDGYYEIDIEKVAKTLARHRAAHARPADDVVAAAKAVVANSHVGKSGAGVPLRSKWVNYPAKAYHNLVAALAKAGQ